MIYVGINSMLYHFIWFNQVDETSTLLTASKYTQLDILVDFEKEGNLKFYEIFDA